MHIGGMCYTAVCTAGCMRCHGMCPSTRTHVRVFLSAAPGPQQCFSEHHQRVGELLCEQVAGDQPQALPGASPRSSGSKATTQGPGCLFPAVSQPVRPVMLGLATISRMAAWHLPLPHPDGQVPGAPSWGNASPWPLSCLPGSVPGLQHPIPMLDVLCCGRPDE